MIDILSIVNKNIPTKRGRKNNRKCDQIPIIVDALQERFYNSVKKKKFKVVI